MSCHQYLETGLLACNEIGMMSSNVLCVEACSKNNHIELVNFSVCGLDPASNEFCDVVLTS